MWRTAIVSVLLLLCGYSAAAWITRDFQVWTDEGARRHDVALHPVPAPAVAVQGPGVTAAELPALLAAGGGVVIEGGGSIFGAIGVSGAPGGEADDACAKAGIEAIADDIAF